MLLGIEGSFYLQLLVRQVAEFENGGYFLRSSSSVGVHAIRAHIYLVAQVLADLGIGQ